MVHQLSKLTQMQRASEQYDRDEETRGSTGFITKLFKEDGYGFLQALDGREIYFHQNSVLHQDFNQLKLGACVHFCQEEGEQGPQATTIQVVDKR